MATSGREETVYLTRSPSALPGYRLVPKGTPYMTLNCRKQTLAAGQTVYQVLDRPGGRVVGIRVPAQIRDAVAASSRATKSQRAEAVRRRDDKMDAAYRDAVVRIFPRLPAGELRAIMSRAMEKRSGRVGRTGTLDVEDRAVLGVRAHVRHVHTRYERMLKEEGARRNGKGGEAARNRARWVVEKDIQSKLEEWGYRGAHGRRGQDSGRSRGDAGGGRESRRERKKRKKKEKRHGMNDDGVSAERAGRVETQASAAGAAQVPTTTLAHRPKEKKQRHRNKKRKHQPDSALPTSRPPPPHKSQRGFTTTTTRSVAREPGVGVKRVATRSMAGALARARSGRSAAQEAYIVISSDEENGDQLSKSTGVNDDDKSESESDYDGDGVLWISSDDGEESYYDDDDDDSDSDSDDY
ncbi:DUF2293 domain-containing protein [Microdochium nivale]|nr:DUF2293 domain-containing protein [Microdochium nivale]